MGSLLRKIRRNIQRSRDALKTRREILNVELSEISKVDDDLKLADEVLNEFPFEDQVFLSQIDNSVINYLGSITILNEHSSSDTGIIYSGSSIPTEISSFLAKTNFDASLLINTEIENIRQMRDDRQIVYSLLLEIDKTIAEIFISSWNILDSQIIDPGRGPAFLMREAIYQFFHHFAPEEAVKKMSWCVPLLHTGGITYPDRIKYIYEEILDPNYRLPTVLDQLKKLKKVIDELSSAHAHGEVDLNHIKTQLFLAQDYLKSLLLVLPRGRNE